MTNDYNIFRWYRTEWGRYTQADPLSVAFSDANAFRYAGDNPLRFFDPSGLVTVKQTYTQRGTLTLPGDGFYSLGFAKATASGTCVGCEGHWKIPLTLNFDHGYWCRTTNSSKIEIWHANIASAFIARAAQQWNVYEKKEYKQEATCEANANYYADDLAQNIVNGSRWPQPLLRDYNQSQRDYEDTHHGPGWLGTCDVFKGACGAY